MLEYIDKVVKNPSQLSFVEHIDVDTEDGYHSILIDFDATNGFNAITRSSIVCETQDVESDDIIFPIVQIGGETMVEEDAIYHSRMANAGF